MLGRLSFLVVLLWAFSAPVHAQSSAFTGTEAQFYTPPTTLPAGPPGTIIRWQRFDASVLVSTVGFGVDSIRVMYITEDAAQNRVAVTGALLVPKFFYLEGIIPKTRPVVALASGTQGMGDQCAPSKGFANSTNYDLLYARAALEKGWAVALSDYQGLGTPGEHHYVVGLSLGKAVLDSVRALYNIDAIFDRDLFLPDLASVGNDAKVLLWGYSEGGGGAAWANELNQTYPTNAAKLNVIGAAAGGVPADIIKVGEAINKPGSLQNIAFGVLLAAGIGFDAVYNLALKSKLNSDGVKLYEQVRTTCVVENVFRNVLKNDITKYTIGGFNPLKDSVWKSYFQANSLGKAKPVVPTFLFHGKYDEAVEYCQGLKLAQTYCNANQSQNKVQWTAYDGEHVTPFLQALDAEKQFLQDRVDGKAFTGTPCAQIVDRNCP